MYRFALSLVALSLTLLTACSTEEHHAPLCESEIVADAAGNPTVRVFSVGILQDLDAMVDYAGYIRIFEEAMAREAPCFSEDVPNLVVFPEDSALMAAFIGSRGELAREEDDTTRAFTQLLRTYADPARYYQEEFPGTPPVRRLLLAMTDVLGRVIEDTFPPLAEKYGVYVATNVNVAPYAESTDPDLIARLGDPDLPDQQSVYVATAPEVYNVAIVYGPDGQEIGRVRKAYLVPAEETDLEMNYGPLEQLRPIETSFGRLAPVISKDAWMPDVLERFNDLGADIMLQHEAFSGWAITQVDGDWLPDVVTESGWNHTQAYDSFRYNIMPCLTGNLVDLVFDCQSAIWKEADPEDTPMAFMGQEPMGGFLDIGAWVMPDPGEQDPSLSVEERRAILRERGQALMPGTGGEQENQYVQSVARGDLAVMYDEAGLPTRQTFVEEVVPPGNLSAAEDALAPYSLGVGGANMIRPDAAVGGEGFHGLYIVYLVLEQTTALGPLTYKPLRGLTYDNGLTHHGLFSEASRPYAGRITNSGSSVYVVAVQDSEDGSASDLLLARSSDAGETWTDKAPESLNEGEWARWNPAIAADGDRLAIAWTDRRDLRSDIYLALSDDAGDTFDVRRMNDLHFEESVRDRPRNPRNNQALPSVAIRGDTIFVSWADFRNYAWDIYGTWSTDAGQTWPAQNRRLNPLAEMVGDIEKERVHGIHQVLLLDDRALILYEGVDDRGPFRRIHSLSICLVDCGESELVSVLPFPAGDPSFRPHLSRAGDTVYAAWQDLRNGDNDIFWSSLDVHGTAWSPAQAVAPARGQQFNPRVAGSTVVWEDWRTGRGRAATAELAGP